VGGCQKGGRRPGRPCGGTSRPWPLEDARWRSNASIRTLKVSVPNTDRGPDPLPSAHSACRGATGAVSATPDGASTRRDSASRHLRHGHRSLDHGGRCASSGLQHFARVTTWFYVLTGSFGRVTLANETRQRMARHGSTTSATPPVSGSSGIARSTRAPARAHSNEEG